MHEEVLDSARHPLLVLRPERIEVSRREADALAGTLFGRFEVRGASHPLALTFEGARRGERARVTVRFDVPWVAWGLPDPSNVLLCVDDDARGRGQRGAGRLAAEKRASSAGSTSRSASSEAPIATRAHRAEAREALPGHEHQHQEARAERRARR